MTMTEQPASPPGAIDVFAEMREAMVDSQLRPNAVNDPRVIAAMAAVPRERFVGAGHREAAYADVPLPLGGGRVLNLPMTTGRLLTEAGVRTTDRVLLIGAATGYVAAVLARLAARVTALEDDPLLLAEARDNLAGLANVDLVEAPLAAGWPASAPYDLIVIDGAVEDLPEALANQLSGDGRIVTGLVDRGVTRLAAGRGGHNALRVLAFADACIAPLAAFAKPRGFTF